MELGLKVMAQFLKGRLALAGFQKFLEHITTRVFKLMRRAGSSASAVALNQACFRVRKTKARDVNDEEEGCRKNITCLLICHLRLPNNSWWRIWCASSRRTH